MKAVNDELAKMVSTHYGIKKKEAEEIISTDEGWQELIKWEDRFWTLKGLRELMPELFSAAVNKAERGWTANAKDAVVAMNILKEKLIDRTQGSPTMNIGGKNVQINMGWKPRWLKNKKKKK